MNKISTFINTIKNSLLLLFFSTTSVFASGDVEGLDAMDAAGGWLTKLMFYGAFSILAPTIMWNLFLVKQGRKEMMEAVKPIAITTLIVSVPLLVRLLKTLIVPLMSGELS